MTPAMDSAGENQTPAALVHRWSIRHLGRDIEGKELRRNFQGSLRFASCSQLRDEESPESPKTDQNSGMSQWDLHQIGPLRPVISLAYSPFFFAPFFFAGIFAGAGYGENRICRWVDVF